LNQKAKTLFVAALCIIGVGAALLARIGGHQSLGKPGVNWTPIPSQIPVTINLPAKVGEFDSEAVPMLQLVLDVLPKDTSFAQRRYSAPDGFWAQMNVVLMGTDRTSIHKPQFCLEGAGWRIDPNSSRQEFVHIDRPHPYDLPVMKFISNRTIEKDGRSYSARGIYVFWFVADNEYTSSHWKRMWWMARDVLTTGVLPRWAYVSYLSVCEPGQEDATFERMKKLISASVPEFQLTPRPSESAMAPKP